MLAKIPTKHTPLVDKNNKAFIIFNLQMDMQLIKMEHKFKHLIDKARKLNRIRK